MRIRRFLRSLRGSTLRPVSRSGSNQTLNDANEFLKGPRLIIPLPGNPIVCPDGGSGGPEDHSFMRGLFYVLARERDPEAFPDKSHERRFQLAVLHESGCEACPLAR